MKLGVEGMPAVGFFGGDRAAAPPSVTHTHLVLPLQRHRFLPQSWYAGEPGSANSPSCCRGGLAAFRVPFIPCIGMLLQGSPHGHCPLAGLATLSGPGRLQSISVCPALPVHQ